MIFFQKLLEYERTISYIKMLWESSYLLYELLHEIMFLYCSIWWSCHG